MRITIISHMVTSSILSEKLFVIIVVACIVRNVWHSADERDEKLYITYKYETGKKDDT